MSDGMYVIGTGMTAFGKFPQRTIRDLVSEVVEDAIRDADCDPAQIGFVAVGNAIGSLMTGQAMIQGQLALLDGALAGAQIVNVENACASGSSALQLAIMAVRSGSCDTAMAIGVESMSTDKERAFQALGAGVDINDPEVMSADRGSVFMRVYAQEARDYMAATGAPALAFAHTAAMAGFHGSLNPKAQYRIAHTPEEILESRTIDDPLTLLMCSPIGDGAAAVIVSRRRPRGDAVAVRGASLRSGTRKEGGGLAQRVSRLAFASAGLAPSDIDVFEVHDAASSATLPILEEIEAVPHAHAWRMALNDEFRHDGALPVNTSGGLISRGHPVGATGLAQIVELTEQLLGSAGGRQVAGARRALAHNAGGAVTTGTPYTPAVCAVTVLERV